MNQQLKSADWEYEEEIRVVKLRSEIEKNGSQAFHFNPNALRKIIFGCKAHKSTIDKYLKNLRLFFKYLYEEGYMSINYSLYIPKTKYLLKSKIPYYWNDDDIEKLLSSIDITTINGKRDYAILNLIINLGLRAIDVINLTLDNINWNNNTLVFSQHKTSELQTLPLLPSVGNCLIDYIINARNREVKTRILFLNDNNVDIIEKSSKISRILKKYEKKANIIVDKSFKNGVHSFRNTLARKLLDDECTLERISQVLGHVNPNTARIYLKIDIKHLRNCVLDWREL